MFGLSSGCRSSVRRVRCNDDIIEPRSQLTRLRWSERTEKSAPRNCRPAVVALVITIGIIRITNDLAERMST